MQHQHKINNKIELEQDKINFLIKLKKELEKIGE